MMAQEPSRGNDRMSARIIHDGSSRNRAVALRDGHVEPRGLTPFPASTRGVCLCPEGDSNCLDCQARTR
jgi:hypothetical protein